MSASLVGSEMCIRDSARPVPDDDDALVRRAVEGRPPQPRPYEGQLPLAVSYTHLTLPTICSV
eukprot:11768130-Alexandrium_andersonii.AAC.1